MNMRRLLSLILCLFLFAGICARAEDAESMLKKGELYFQDGKYEQALACYELVVMAEPDNLDVRKAMIQLYIAMEKWEKLPELLDEQLKNDPFSAESWLMKLQVCMHLDDAEGTEKALLHLGVLGAEINLYRPLVDYWMSRENYEAVVMLYGRIDFSLLEEMDRRNYALAQLRLEGFTPEKNMLILLFEDDKRSWYQFMGEMKTPEGYDRAPYETYQDADPNEQRFQFTAQDASRPSQSVYVTGVANKTGEEMLTTLRDYGLYQADAEDVVTEIAGHKVRYMYSVGNPYVENTDVYSVMLVLYVDVLDGSSVAFNFNSAHGTIEELPHEGEMLKDVEEFLSCFTAP